MMENVPAIPLAGLIAARDRAKAAAGGTGEMFLKLEKSGEWVYGPNDEPLEEDSLWAVDPNSFVEGYIAWHSDGGNVLGEEMRPATDQPIQLSELPTISGGSWSKQLGFSLMCLNGEDKGLRAIYKTNSKGGVRAVSGLLTEIIERLNDGEIDEIIPVIKFEVDSYKHKKYGRIFVPELQVQSWAKISSTPKAEAEKVEAEKAEPEPEEPPRRRRRRRVEA